MPNPFRNLKGLKLFGDRRNGLRISRDLLAGRKTIFMSPDVSELLKKPSRSRTETRAAVDGSLLKSLDDEPCDEDVEAAWNEEIKRRIEEIYSGKVQMIPYEEVRRRWWPCCQMPASKPYRFHPQAWQEVVYFS